VIKLNVLIFGGINYEKDMMYIKRGYYEVILSLGCEVGFFPMSIYAKDKLIDYIKKYSAVLFCGGEDIHPFFYNQEPQKGIRKINRLRDEIEIEAIQIAYDMGKRVLAICRGIQLMNISFGGTLHQDIEKIQSTISHWQDTNDDGVYHSVRIEGNLFTKIFNNDSIFVNSYHHQAIDKIAPGFKIEAIAPDGIIEGISKNDREFFVGVQWHPELMWRENKEQQKLFEWFVGD